MLNDWYAPLCMPLKLLYPQWTWLFDHDHYQSHVSEARVINLFNKKGITELIQLISAHKCE